MEQRQDPSHPKGQPDWQLWRNGVDAIAVGTLFAARVAAAGSFCSIRCFRACSVPVEHSSAKLLPAPCSRTEWSGSTNCQADVFDFAYLRIGFHLWRGRDCAATVGRGAPAGCDPNGRVVRTVL